jgi:CPA1 family monovalent cation:H+ antiporter
VLVAACDDRPMSGEATLGAVRLFVALVAAAVAVTLLARRLRLQDSVGLVLLGLAVAIAAPDIDLEITPELVLAVLLPGLVFEGAYRTRVEELRQSLLAVVLLAVPGVVIVAALVGVILSSATDLTYVEAFIVGAMVSATDPAAVLATFKRLRSPRVLSTAVEAESLVNDGTGIVLFTVAVAALGQDASPASGALEFARVVALSGVIGLAAGLAASRLIPLLRDHLLEVAVSLVLAYGTYLLADALHLSGIIATVAAGVTLGSYGRTRGMSTRTAEAIDTVWEFVAFVLTALVFVLIGLAITIEGLVAAALPIGWGIIAILAGRALVVYILLGGTARIVRGRRRPPGLPLRWLHVMFWAGLRGAVAVALALSLPDDLPRRDLLRDVVFGIVLFTLVVQGSTVAPVVRRFASTPSRGQPSIDEPDREST